MATKFDSSMFPSNSTNALIQQWATFIHDLLVTTGGWTNTADSGQTATGSLTTPGGVNTKVGYRIYAMADSLQASYPVYMRIDFGSGAAANTPGIWVTIGTGSNGSGTITNITFNGGSVAAPTFACGGNNAATATNSYGSADTARAAVMLFANSSQASRGLTFVIERSKDVSGADTGDGVLLHGSTASASINFSRYIVRAGGSQPADEAGVQMILSAASPTTFGGNVGVGIVIPMAGSAQPPGTQMIATRTGDFSAESSFNMAVYGATRTYQLAHTQGMNWAISASSGSANHRVGIQYD